MESHLITEKPDHVPEHLVYDFDYLAPPGAEHDIHLAWNRLHDEGIPDIFWTPRYGGHWILTRADDIDAIQPGSEVFSFLSMSIPINEAPRIAPLEMDVPEHAKYRLVLAPFFGPRQAQEMIGFIRDYSNQLIDAFIDKGECEFVREFANRLPIDIFLNMVGLPLEDRDYLLKIAEMSTHPKVPEDRMRAAQELSEYCEKWLLDRRANPRDDLMTAMATATIDGRPFTDQETHGMLINVLFGGLDTVASTMGFIARFLAENPDHRRQLVEDPDLIKDAVEEFLRRFGIPQTARTLTQDFDYRGIRFKQGEQVLLPKVLHGLDERRYKDPLTVDFQRKPRDHAGFGGGPHKCIGMHLARQEIRIFIEEWLRRIPEFEIKPGEQPLTCAGSTNGMLYLPLVWNTHR